MKAAALPECWNTWTITKAMGAGSFGTVYRAERESNGQTEVCAVKEIRIPRMARSQEEMMRKFLGEQELEGYYRRIIGQTMDEAVHMRKLNACEHTVTLEDDFFTENADGEGWTIFLRMEFLDCLGSMVRDGQKKMDLAEIRKLGMDLCKALICCEQQNVFHRDIKPDNIFLTEDGTYKLGDFGISIRSDIKRSKAQIRRETKGTVNYMAPEILRGEAYSVQADIYSLGMVLLRMMNAMEDTADRRKQSRTEKRMEEGLMKIIEHACAQEKEDRFENAERMLEALREVA